MHPFIPLAHVLCWGQMHMCKVSPFGKRPNNSFCICQSPRPKAFFSSISTMPLSRKMVYDTVLKKSFPVLVASRPTSIYLQKSALHFYCTCGAEPFSPCQFTLLKCLTTSKFHSGKNLNLFGIIKP
jgi:hypothetical protein